MGRWREANCSATQQLKDVQFYQVLCVHEDGQDCALCIWPWSCIRQCFWEKPRVMPQLWVLGQSQATAPMCVCSQYKSGLYSLYQAGHDKL